MHFIVRAFTVFVSLGGVGVRGRERMMETHYLGAGCWHQSLIDNRWTLRKQEAEQISWGRQGMVQ